MDKQYRIAEFIRVANEHLSFCEEIVGFPVKMGKKNYDPSVRADNFYKRICNVFFDECVLIVASLLNKKDKRVISLFNWEDFCLIKQKELNEITIKFNDYGFKTVRDQVVGHHDENNYNNNIPSNRVRGMIDERLIMKLREILDGIIKEFCDAASVISHTIYKSEVYFSPDLARMEVNEILTKANPSLTDNNVI